MNKSAALFGACLGAFVNIASAASPPAEPSPQAVSVGYGGAFILVYHHGKTVLDEAFRGKLLLVAFGYTHCPDLCPTLLTTMAGALAQLGAQGETVQPLFITVDPARGHGHLQRRRQLRHEADALQHVRASRPRVEALYANDAIRDKFAEDAADQRGLAGAIGADQRAALAGRDAQRQVVEHTGVAEGLGKFFNGSSDALLDPHVSPQMRLHRAAAQRAEHFC